MVVAAAAGAAGAAGVAPAAGGPLIESGSPPDAPAVAGGIGGRPHFVFSDWTFCAVTIRAALQPNPLTTQPHTGPASPSKLPHDDEQHNPLVLEEAEAACKALLQAQHVRTKRLCQRNRH